MQQPDADNPSADSDSGGPAGTQTQAERVIAKFGGIRPMAAKLSVAVTTVQGWKERGTIPPRRQAEILAAAQAAGIDLDESDFAMPEGAAEAPDEPVAEPVERVQPDAGPWRDAKSSASSAEPPVIDAPPQPRTRGGGGRTALWIVIVLVLAAIAGGAGWWYGRQNPAGVDLGPIERRLAAAESKLERLPEIESAATAAGERAAAAADAVARLEASLTEQADRIAALESRPTAGGAPADGGAVQAALDETRKAVADARAATERTLDTLRDDVTRTVAEAKDANAQAVAEIRAETQRLAGALQEATRRIAALEATEAEAAAGGARLAALIAAIGQLRQAVLSGRPYDAELEAMRALQQDGAPPAPALAAHAETGVASLDTLRNDFSRRAAAIVDAASTPEGGDWIDRTLHRLSTIVTVRRTGGDVSGDDPESVVARAERQLADGDLAGAVATVGALAGPGAEAAAPWLDEARKTLDAAAAVKALQDAAMARVDGGGAPADTSLSGSAPGGSTSGGSAPAGSPAPSGGAPAGPAADGPAPGGANGGGDAPDGAAPGGAGQ